jgi:hypothetical protein
MGLFSKDKEPESTTPTDIGSFVMDLWTRTNPNSDSTESAIYAVEFIQRFPVGTKVLLGDTKCITLAGRVYDNQFDDYVNVLNEGNNISMLVPWDALRKAQRS